MTSEPEYEQSKFATKLKEGATEEVYIVDDQEVPIRFGRLQHFRYGSIGFDGELTEARVHDILRAYEEGVRYSRLQAEADVKRDVRHWLEVSKW